MKKLSFALIILLSFTGAAQAQTIGTLVDSLFTTGQLVSLSGLIEGFAYLGGIAMAIKGMLKLNEWNESKGRNVKLTTGLTYILCGGLLLALPMLIQMGSETILGTPASQEFNSQSGQYGGQY